MLFEHLKEDERKMHIEFYNSIVRKLHSEIKKFTDKYELDEAYFYICLEDNIEHVGKLETGQTYKRNANGSIEALYGMDGLLDNIPQS